MRHRIYLALLAFLNAAAYSGAQIPMEEIDVIKKYRPVLSDLAKVQVKAEPPPRDTTRLPITYRAWNEQLRMSFLPAEVKPLAVPRLADEPLQNNLIKAGFGTQLSPLLEAYLSKGRSSAAHYGLQTRFTSARAVRVPFQSDSRWEAMLHGTSFFQQTALNGAITFDRNHFRYYAFSDPVEKPADYCSDGLLCTTLFGTGVQVGLRNTDPNKWAYEVRLRYRHQQQNALLPLLQDTVRWRPREGTIGVQAKLAKKISEESLASLELHYQSATYHADPTDTSLILVTASPSYTHRFRSLVLKGGLRFYAGSERVELFPLAEMQYKLAGDYLIAYAQLHKQYALNTFQHVIAENPYVIGYVPFSGKFIEALGGIKGVYAENLSYNFYLSHRWWKNQIFYYPFQQLLLYYHAVAHPAGTTLLFGGEAQYRMAENLAVRFEGSISRWRPDGMDHPIGRIPHQGKVTVDYRVKEKIRVEAAVYAFTGVYTVTPAGDTVALTGVIDPNLTVTYHYRPHLSFWVGGYNLANMKQRQWYGYISYGIRAAGGVLILF
ncbi:MAG: hypothetical protein NZL95_07180 [Chitinophagales bacterium]|nr:hypothetical protein [Chitinophagales bacterium]MDW8428319.1 hypothetical protein [Chitinophagales bacterium]